MPDSIPSEPAQTLFGTLETATSLSREILRQVGMALLQHLLEGQPVPLETLEEATGQDREEIARLLDRMEAERGENGEVVGLGLSLRPTPHQYKTGGKIFYGWCAADTLLFPPILQHTARVTSRDPISGAAIDLRVSPDAVERVDPSSAAITWVEDGTPVSLRESFCFPSRFFASAATAQQWAAEHENADVRSVEEAHEAARTIADRIREGRISN
ncbi:MAG: organomercurial lyase [Salinibacter sp.]